MILLSIDNGKEHHEEHRCWPAAWAKDGKHMVSAIRAWEQWHESCLAMLALGFDEYSSRFQEWLRYNPPPFWNSGYSYPPSDIYDWSSVTLVANEVPVYVPKETP